MLRIIKSKEFNDLLFFLSFLHFFGLLFRSWSDLVFFIGQESGERYSWLRYVNFLGIKDSDNIVTIKDEWLFTLFMVNQYS